MKRAVWYNNKDIRIEEVAKPQPGPREMLVKVLSCGICGSDIVEWYRLPRAPLVPGHEIGGEVAVVGDAVKSFETGERVFIAPKVPCMECYYCQNDHYPVCGHVKDRLPGGLAECIVVPEALIARGTYRLPDAINYDQSTFIEPLACVLRAQRLAGIESHHTVMVMGCGMSGLLHLKVAKFKGCKTIAVDINPNRLAVSRTLGADVVVHAQDDFFRVLDRLNGKKPDVVMLCTSAGAAIHQAWQTVDKGGAVVFFAVPAPEVLVTIPINDFWMKEIRVLTSYYCGPPDIEDAMTLLGQSLIEVEDIVTHRLPLKDTPKGFQLVQQGDASIKVIIKPNE